MRLCLHYIGFELIWDQVTDFIDCACCLRPQPCHGLHGDARCPTVSPCLLAVDGRIHILSTERAHSKHCIWNDVDRSLERFHCDFPRTIHRVATVHLPSRGILLAIRWYGIWTYSLRDGQWTHLLALRDGVAMTHLSAVVTANQKHVIVTGRQQNALRTYGYIKVLDIEDAEDGRTRFRLRPTAIRMDSVAAGWMWKTSDPAMDDTLVVGYIKRLFRSKGFRDCWRCTPPLYIMRFLCKWYSEQLVHWVAKYDHDADGTLVHRAMGVRDILKYTKGAI